VGAEIARAVDHFGVPEREKEEVFAAIVARKAEVVNPWRRDPLRCDNGVERKAVASLALDDRHSVDDLVADHQNLSAERQCRRSCWSGRQRAALRTTFQGRLAIPTLFGGLGAPDRPHARARVAR